MKTESSDYPNSINCSDEPNMKKTASETMIGGGHYMLPIQPVDYILKNNLGFLEGNVIKYVTRHKTKNGVEDINKAIHYLELIKEKVYA